MAFEYPLREFSDGLRSAAVWVFVVFATQFAGVWLGIWIGCGELPGPTDAFLASVLMLFGAWLLHPGFFAAPAVMALALYVPLKVESRWLYIVAAVVNLVAWIAITAWVVRPIGIGL